MLNHSQLLQRLLKVHFIGLLYVFHRSSRHYLHSLVYLLLRIPELNLTLVQYFQSLFDAFALVFCLVELLVLLDGYH